ncbi:MAG: tripartite tricarboxylate transporter substrate binding protein [Xanthobacteraceae bacterium]|jgi:tripartite-type tricarboxylate transporter receptor subunit TctC
MRPQLRSVVIGFLSAALVAAALPAWAQTFPSRPVHLVVSYAPGGTGDIVARLISDKLAAALGQTVVVENRAGASGSIGAQSVVSATPDGHTLLVGQPAEVAINQHWIRGLGYDPINDLQPVALATVVPLALVIPAAAPYATVADMLKASKARGLSFASAGTGTPGHFAGELLKLKTGSNLTHVPYKGAGPALNDLLGNHVDLFFSGFPAAWAQVKAGKLKLIAVSPAKRSPAAPDVPTVAEASGIADFDISLWQGVFAPRATPKEVVARLNAELNRIVTQPEIRERLRNEGADVIPLAVDQFAAFVKSESEKYLNIIKQSGVKPE